MGDAHKPSDKDKDTAGDTQVARGAQSLRARATTRGLPPLSAPKPSTPAPAPKPSEPAFEETFAADDGSDAGEPPTEIWSANERDLSGALVPADEFTDEVTRAVQDAELSEVIAAAAPAAENDPHAWYLGRSFGGFRIVRAIASGGMATVFLARKEGPARVSKHAAIKVVHPHLAYEREFVGMFLDEARIAALIDHPNVCRVLDFGMAEGTYYLAMEYLLGETWSTVRSALSEHPEGARMVPTVSAYVLAQACEGLHAAHEALDDTGHPLSIVHRDISPQNIFVAYDGTVRVLDFGIARAADRITNTRDGVLKGRLAYMSPEQMSIAEISPAADIWSIGVVLREALEGKRLFRRGSDAETMLAVTQEALPAWSDGVPEVLRAICDRALARDPSQRQTSASMLGSELAQYVQSSRAPIGSSELSVWMGLLFGAQMEQKRALLQLPVPPAREGESPPLPPPPLEEAEPSEASLPAQGPITVPARPDNKKGSLRPLWLNPPALLALASVGAIVGVFLGRVLHRDPFAEGRPPPAAQLSPAKEARVDSAPAAPRPVVDQLPPSQEKPVVSQLAPGAKSTPPAPAPASTAQRPANAAPPAAAPAPPARARERAAASDQAAREGPAPGIKTTSSDAAQQTGTVLVAFEGGWAEISLGGKRLGTTPGRFVIPAGKQTLSVRPFGTGKPFTKRVELAPDQVLKVFLAPPKP